MSTVFGKILRGEIPADKVYEDDRCIVIRDINPVAPMHLLVIPRQEIARLDRMSEADEALVGHLLKVATEVAQEEGLADYRVVINNGAGSGQTVWHLHVHVIGGRSLSWPPG
jgi:histidine triad (HIT) family protein